LTIASSPELRTFIRDESLGPTGDLPLPFDGWQLYRGLRSNGRHVLEVNNHLGDLVGLLVSSSRSTVSVDGAWRGLTHDDNGTRRWWSLAIGHVTDDDETAVTFLRRPQHHIRSRRMVLRPRQSRGLWFAAAPGLYSTVSCHHGNGHAVSRIASTSGSRGGRYDV
jgi:hypothetical protein